MLNVYIVTYVAQRVTVQEDAHQNQTRKTVGD